MNKPALIRYSGNPILEPTSNWWEKRAVFNPAAFIFRGKIYLLYRAMGNITVSQFGLAQLKDPFTVEKRFDEPILTSHADNEYERLGIEDPRVVKIDNQFAIVNVSTSLNEDSDAKPLSYSRSGTPWRIRLSLVTTSNFKKFNRHGVILDAIDTKNGTLFPEKIDGKYVLLHRIFPDIWISSSKKIDVFSKGSILCRPNKDGWDNDRIGAGAPPLKTSIGWLEFYNGVTIDSKGNFRYMIGILLLDLKDPRKILYRSDEPILEPVEKYEREGNVNNVIFTCGAIEWKDKYYVYYGAGDRVVAVAYINKKELLEYLSAQIAADE